MSESRSKHTKRNIVSGLLRAVFSTGLQFLNRTALLYFLGQEFVGLSSLFTSILQVLNLAELGFSNAVVFHMYSPLAKGDTQTVCALMAYYRKVYRVIGSAVTVGGIALLPFLPFLIEGAWPETINIYVLYLIYLFNTGISYFLFAYKSALLNALQRIDMVNRGKILVEFFTNILQVLILLWFKNYYLYALLIIISTVFRNLYISYISDKHFPQYICCGSLSQEVKKDIKVRVSGLMIGKLSDTSRNAFDSIVISAVLGLSAVAIYNNYFFVYSGVYGVLLIITNAMQASVGNSIATETKEKNYRDLRRVTFIMQFLASWCTVCMLCLYQPFMTLWVGHSLTLPAVEMILFCIYFYAINMNNSRNLYFTGNGLWWEGRWTFFGESVGNLALNILLGILFGIKGVLLATIITIIIFNFIQRSNLLFKSYYNMPPRVFYRDHILYVAVTTVVCFLTYIVCDMVPETIGQFGELLIKLVITGGFPPILYLLFYCKHPVFWESARWCKRIIK